MVKEFQGICPRCRINTGSVGQACPNPDCLQHEYSYIPLLAYDAASAQAEKKGGRIDPWLGRRFDRYLLTGKAGEGGMGTVYIALQAPLNREVALKVMTQISISREALDRFETEAKALSALDHPNILKLFDYGFGNLDGQTIPYMVLEYVKHGRTLKKVMQQDIGQIGVMKPETRLPIFEQILCGLAAAHAVGITHRDVKPENVMLTQIHGNPNFAKILDFGLATGLRGDGPGQTGMNQILGTPNYMAPEQIPGAKRIPIDHRADLYAVGVVLFEALTGVRPFPGDTALAVLTAKSNERYNPFDIPAVSKLSRQQRNFLEKAIAFLPTERFQSATEMLDALQAVLSEPAQKKALGLFSFVGGKTSGSQPAINLGDSLGNTPNPTPTPTPTPFQINNVKRPQTPFKASTGPISQMRAGTGFEVDGRPRAITGQLGTMTPEERAERLKNRKRRTTGRHMAAARVAEAHAGRERPVMISDAKKGSIVAVAGVGLVLIIALAFLIPHFREQRRFSQLEADLKVLSVPLSNNGKFVGTDSPFLLPGAQTDHFVADALKSGQPALDPWGNPYRVKYSMQNPAGYVLFSTGPDGAKDDCGRGDDSDDTCVSLGPP